MAHPFSDRTLRRSTFVVPTFVPVPAMLTSRDLAETIPSVPALETHLRAADLPFFFDLFFRFRDACRPFFTDVSTWHIVPGPSNPYAG